MLKNDADVNKTGQKLLVGNCSEVMRKKSLAGNDNGKKAQKLGGFFKDFGKSWLNSKKIATKVINNRGKALEGKAKLVVQRFLEILRGLYLLSLMYYVPIVLLKDNIFEK